MTPYKLYKIIIEKKVQKFLEKLPDTEKEKIILKISDLTSSHFKSLNIKKLQGYRNLYRIKIDNYRVIFIVIPEKKLIAIAVIGHRKEIYDIIKRMSF